MKKLITLLSILTLNTSFGQEFSNFNECGTEYNETLYDKEFETLFQNEVNSQYKNLTNTIYYIPVVFHVIHTGEPIGQGSNISDATIYNALRDLNNNLKNNHNHPNNSNTNIQYVLATKAPNGSCSSGINRINYSNNTTYVQYGNRRNDTDNGVDATILRSLSNWDPLRYYNVWIVNKITSTSNVAAYAYYPSAHGQSIDGTFINFNSFSASGSKVLTHEIGHSLNLMHTFQGSDGSNCPSQTNGCGADGDCIADTPAHKKTHPYDLIITETNPCSGNNDSSFKYNYMSYNSSIHINAFTPQQVTRMRSAIPFYRSSYLPENNTVFNFTNLPQANFTVNNMSANEKFYICTGAIIKLQNISKCFLNTFNNTPVPNNTSLWTITKNGQLISQSSLNNPDITLNAPGSYNITLKVTNNFGHNTITKNNIIEVVAPSTITYCTPNSTNVGYFGMSIDKVNFGGITNTTLSANNFGYMNYSCTHIGLLSKVSPNNISVTVSHTNQNVESPIILKGYIDYNENGSFEANELILTSTIPSGTFGEVKNFVINASQNAEIGKIYRMRLAINRASLTESHINCSSTFNVGDIEDYGVTFTNTLDSDNFNVNDFKIYPNPTTNTLNISSKISGNKKVSIFDVTGKLIKSIEENNDDFIIDVSNLKNGSYILKINNVSYQFLKK